MRSLQYFACLTAFAIFLACEKNENPVPDPEVHKFVFQDGFETQNSQLEELFPADGSRWSKIQQTNPSNATNEILLSNLRSTEGESSLRIYANQSDAMLSKVDIEKGGFIAVSGDQVTISADFFIPGSQALTNLLLIDLECCSCWDPDVGDNYGSENQCPGVRLMMSGEDDYLSIERGKISGVTLEQSTVSFPRDQWVNVEWEMTLSTAENGRNILRINSMPVIDEDAMNLPNAKIFREVFAQEGIDFDLKQPSFYERVQIGATANPQAGDVELFVDNFAIKVN